MRLTLDREGTRQLITWLAPDRCVETVDGLTLDCDPTTRERVERWSRLMTFATLHRLRGKPLAFASDDPGPGADTRLLAAEGYFFAFDTTSWRLIGAREADETVRGGLEPLQVRFAEHREMGGAVLPGAVATNVFPFPMTVQVDDVVPGAAAPDRIDVPPQARTGDPFAALWAVKYVAWRYFDGPLTEVWKALDELEAFAREQGKIIDARGGAIITPMEDGPASAVKTWHLLLGLVSQDEVVPIDGEVFRVGFMPDTEVVGRYVVGPPEEVFNTAEALSEHLATLKREALPGSRPALVTFTRGPAIPEAQKVSVLIVPVLPLGADPEPAEPAE